MIIHDSTRPRPNPAPEPRSGASGASQTRHYSHEDASVVTGRAPGASQRWGAGLEGGARRRALPCIYLGAIVDLSVRCPARRRRQCELHGPVLLSQCQSCDDYEEDS